MSTTVLVTGASRGIGNAVARSFASQKCKVIAVARSEKPLKKLKEKFPNFIDYYSVDLTDAAQIETLVEAIISGDDKIDILINNAGALINKSFKELSRSDWIHLFEANVLTAVELTKALLPCLNEGGHIVNISSMGGFQGSEKFEGLSAYSCTKGALSILSEALAVELKDQNVKANTLCLGSAQTAMFEEAFPGYKANVSAEQMGDYIADFALNGSDFYNGKILPVALDK